MLGNRGRIGSDHLCQFIDAALALAQLFDNEQAAGMCHRLDYFRPRFMKGLYVAFHVAFSFKLFGNIAK